MNFFKKLFGKKQPPKPKFSDEEYEKDYELKTEGLERMLGPSHPMVGHAIIPFAIGGAVDMYYYPHALSGTGFATMELIEPDGTGPMPNRMGTYELVAFTKHSFIQTDDSSHPFNLIERRVCGNFTRIGNYSTEAELRPGDTCEIPDDDRPTRYLVFDEYAPDGRVFHIGNRRHGLLLVIEVFQPELEYARLHGSEHLFEKLKLYGFYPYTDLDREPVA